MSVNVKEPSSIASALLTQGILAPSAHNTQPWLAEVEDEALTLLPDRSRQLRADTLGREMFISLGCFWGNVRLAADSLGIHIKEDFVADGVRIVVEKQSGRARDDPILEAIRSRRHNRFPLTGPFDFRTEAKSGDLEVRVVTDPELRKAIAAVTAEAFKKQLRDRAFRTEFAEWLRPNAGSATDGIPGYALGFPAPLARIMPTIIKRFSMAGPISRRERSLMQSAPAVCLISGPDDERGWITAGRVFEELAISAEQQGYQCAINAAPIEIDTSAGELARLVGMQRPLVLFRIGRPTKLTRATPRRPLADITRTTQS